MNSPDIFLKKRLERSPVRYTVTISHFLSGGEWTMAAEVDGLGSPEGERRSTVAEDLRRAADLLEAGA